MCRLLCCAWMPPRNAAFSPLQTELKESGCGGREQLQPPAAKGSPDVPSITFPITQPAQGEGGRGCHLPRLLAVLRAAGNRWLSAPLSCTGSPPGASDLAGRLNISASRAQLRHVAPRLPPTASAWLLLLGGGGGGAVLSLPLSHPASQAGSERRAAPWRAGDPARPPWVRSAAAFCTRDGASHAPVPERFSKSNEEED